MEDKDELIYRLNDIHAENSDKLNRLIELAEACAQALSLVAFMAMAVPIVAVTLYLL